MNNKALKILLEHDVFEPNETPKADFNYAKAEGYMFDNAVQTHNEAVELAFAELGKCNKQQITNSFLSSLSTHQLHRRMGLPVFAIMQTFPRHAFVLRPKTENQHTCAICSTGKQAEVDFNFINQIRFTCGGIVGYEAYDLAFCLAQQNKLPDTEPTAADFSIFNEIMSLITQAPADEKPSTLQKKLRTVKGFKSNEEERRCLLETLGFCSILESEKHKGFLSIFTDIALAPQNGRSSDWLYPIDWWKGKNGINKQAFDFWFGNYSELKTNGF